MTTAIGKASAAFRAHPNFRSAGTVTSEERHDYVLHANGDPSRDMHVAFLPFLVGPA